MKPQGYCFDLAFSWLVQIFKNELIFRLFISPQRFLISFWLFFWSAVLRCLEQVLGSYTSSHRCGKSCWMCRYAWVKTKHSYAYRVAAFHKSCRKICLQRGREKAKALYYDDPDRMIWVQHAPWSRCYVLGWDVLWWLSLLDGFEQT